MALRSVFRLAGGNAAAQIVTICVLPFLARIYSMADFGQAALFEFVMAILTSVCTGQYEHAIIIEKSRRNIDFLSTLILAISLATSLTVLCLSLGLGLFDWGQEAADILLIASLSVLAYGGYRVAYSTANRDAKYLVLSKAVVFGSLVTALVKVVLGVLGTGATALMIAPAIGQFVAAGIIFKSCRHGSVRLGLLRDRSGVLAVASRYVKFPKYTVLSVLLNRFSQTVYAPIMVHLIGDGFAGAMSLANRCTQMPLSIFGRGVADVYKQTLAHADAGRSERIVVFKRFSMYLLCVAIPVTAVLFFFGEEIFVAVLGEKKRLSGQLASIMSAAIGMSVVAGNMGAAVYVMEKQHYAVVNQTLGIVLTMVSFGFGAYYFPEDPLMIVLMYCIGNCLRYLLEYSLGMQAVLAGRHVSKHMSCARERGQ